MSTTQTRTPHFVDRLPRLQDEEGVRFGLAHAGLIAAAVCAGATGMPRTGSFALLTAAALGGGRGLAARWRIGIAVSAWAIWTGFFENSLGVLTFSGPDVLRLTALCMTAAIATHLSRRRWDRLGP